MMTGEAGPWESRDSLMIYTADHELLINDKWKDNNIISSRIIIIIVQ